jgi:Xaa-Pro aminopeptidase
MVVHVALGGDNREGVPYNVPPDVRINDGQVAFVDFACGYMEYWADMCRTVVVGGKPGRRQSRAHSAIPDARKAIRDGIRPRDKSGTSCSPC